MRSRFAACVRAPDAPQAGRGRTDAQARRKGLAKKKWGGAIALHRARPCGLLSRRAKPITAPATGLHLRRIFPKAEKPPIATLRLCNLAVAVIFGLRRDEGRPQPALCARIDHASGGSNKGLAARSVKGFLITGT